jgi:uncharacterized protein YdaU (DUF1376 family)
MDDRSPAFRKYAQDWLVGTMHLSLEAQGAYERLLCHQWVDGPLPADHAHIAKLLGVTPKRWAKLWEELGRHFPATEDGSYLANPRLEFERSKAEGYRIAKSVAGRAGAAVTWRGHSKGNSTAISKPVRVPIAEGVAKNGFSGSGSLSQSSHPEIPVHSSRLRRASPTAIGAILTRDERPTA